MASKLEEMRRRQEFRRRADAYPWPEEALDCVRKYPGGGIGVRLYPYIDHDYGRKKAEPDPEYDRPMILEQRSGRVITPRGTGTLINMISGHAWVVLDSEARRAAKEKKLPSKQRKPGEGADAKFEYIDSREVYPE